MIRFVASLKWTSEELQFFVRRGSDTEVDPWLKTMVI